MNKIDEIVKLKGLLDSGAISQDQYDLLLSTTIDETGKEAIDETGKEAIDENPITDDTIIIETSKGNQEWSRKNLSIKNYRSGEPIEQLTSARELNVLYHAELNHDPRWMYYNLDPSTEETHGLLYLFPIGIHRYQSEIDETFEPEGWRIPTGDDIEILFTEYGKVIGQNTAYIDKNILSREIDLSNLNSQKIKELFSTKPGATLHENKEQADGRGYQFHFTNKFSAWAHTGNKTTIGNIIFDSTEMKLFEDDGTFVPAVSDAWKNIETMIWDDYFPLSFVKCLKEK